VTPVLLETPYGGEVALHLRYLRACMRDCLLHGESPYAPHHLYTAPGVLRHEYTEERELVRHASLAWRQYATKTVFYTDLGWSEDMLRARNLCTVDGWHYEVRFLEPGWLSEHLEREAAGEAIEDWSRSFGGSYP
jgi:hypothetical protein